MSRRADVRVIVQTETQLVRGLKMTLLSRHGTAIGLIVALGVPLTFLVLAILVQNGLALYEPIHASLGELGALGWFSLVVLAPLGIVIAGWSAGVRGLLSWMALIATAVPAFVILWFICVATLSGTLGNPA